VTTPAWRKVFGCIQSLLTAFIELDAEEERHVTPDDEIGFTIGVFVRSLLAKKDPKRIEEIILGFVRGMEQEEVEEFPPDETTR